MFASLKSEFRKLFTVRTTYFLSLGVLLLMIFYAGYVQGYKIDAAHLRDSGYLASQVTGAIGALSIFVSLIAALLMTHEYSYNTIMYTLTSSNSRARSLFAKLVLISGFSVVFTLVVCSLSPVLTAVGIHLKHLHAVHQVYHYRDLLWRSLLFGWGYGMFGLMFGALLRNRVATITALFLVPGTVESLLGLLLKKNVQYLPFNSLLTMLNQPSGSITPAKAALVALSYIVGGWIIAFALFSKRDAN